jgi:hypothetical protein
MIAAVLLAPLLALTACAAAPPVDPELPPAAPAPPPDPFEDWLAADIPVADGFSAPVGAGWADCGDGCWAHPATGEVLAPAAGRVVEVGPDHIVLEHLWYEDQVRTTARSTWRGVSPEVAVGVDVARGDRIGVGGELRGALGEEGVDAFLLGHRTRFVPQDEPVLTLISHDRDELRIYVDGEEVTRATVGFGQAEGDKQRRGDRMTPKGMYFVVVKSEGPFTGPYGDYYGGTWIKVNYPNAWDAARGVDAGLITGAQQRAITRAYFDRQLTLQGTALGGGIGLHGWAEEWSDDGPRGLSWGCVVMHLRDNQDIYARVPEGSMVVLF